MQYFVVGNFCREKLSSGKIFIDDSDEILKKKSSLFEISPDKVFDSLGEKDSA